jgi:uncharacterized protein YcfL
MGMNSLPKLVLTSCLLTACSPGPDKDPAPPQKTVFDPLLQQEQRARDVQSTAADAASRARQAIDAQERGEAAPGEGSPRDSSR